MVEKTTLENMLMMLNNLGPQTIRVLARELNTVRMIPLGEYDHWEKHQNRVRFYRILVVGTFPTDPKGFIRDIAPDLYIGTHDGQPSWAPLIILPFEDGLAKLVLQTVPAQ